MNDKLDYWFTTVRREQKHLFNAIRRAKGNQGFPYQFELCDDLMLEVLFDNGHTQIQISCQHEVPPLNVFWAILGHWPAAVESAYPTITTHRDRKSLLGKWVTVVKVSDLVRADLM